MTSACFSRNHTGFSRNATLVARVNPPALAGGVFNLGKIYDNPIYAEELLNGTIFAAPLISFGVENLVKRKEIITDYRDDLNEGLSNNIDINKPTINSHIITFLKELGSLPNDIYAAGEIDSHFLCENIYCLSAIFYDKDNKRLCKLNNKMSEFTNQEEGLAVVIFDVNEFLQRVVKTLSNAMCSPYWIAYGLVNYNFNSHDNKELDEFTKDQFYEYQQEFRIAINIEGTSFDVYNDKNVIDYMENDAIKLNIGSIRDIAFLLPVNDYINLNFPDSYQWVITTEPKKVHTFYPPVKKSISYIYPLIRIEKGTFIAECPLYASNNRKDTFFINMKQLKNTWDSYRESKAVFLSILNYYFVRILDIYKSKQDKLLLESILTAFIYYMTMLNIDDCAGIHLNMKNGELLAYYDDIIIHDSNLIDKSKCKKIQKNLRHMKVSDFAVASTLSDQEVFQEYEYKGKKYVRVEIVRHGILPSGHEVKPGEAVWLEVSPVNFLGYKKNID